jgi:phage repressor protein C with HTH and peptisase S24 domain
MEKSSVQTAFIQAVDKLGMRFPVAELSRATGYRPPIVSEYLNGKKTVSESFLRTFCEVYKIDFDSVFGEAENIAEQEPEYGNRRTGEDIRKQKAFGALDDKGLIYVPIAAQAGYTKNFVDPVFINQLDRVFIPGSPYRGNDFRYFDVEGDSMYPTLEEGMQVVAQFIPRESWKDISEFYIHVIVKENQLLIKRLYRRNERSFGMISDNEEMYPQEVLQVKDIKELWLVKRMLDWRMAPPRQFEKKV